MSNLKDDFRDTRKRMTGNVKNNMCRRDGSAKGPAWTTKEIANKYGMTIQQVGRILTVNMKPSISMRTLSGSTKTYWQYSEAVKILEEYISRTDKL